MTFPRQDGAAGTVNSVVSIAEVFRAVSSTSGAPTRSSFFGSLQHGESSRRHGQSKQKKTTPPFLNGFGCGAGWENVRRPRGARFSRGSNGTGRLHRLSIDRLEESAGGWVRPQVIDQQSRVLPHDMAEPNASSMTRLARFWRRPWISLEPFESRAMLRFGAGAGDLHPLSQGLTGGRPRDWLASRRNIWPAVR